MNRSAEVWLTSFLPLRNAEQGQRASIWEVNENVRDQKIKQSIDTDLRMSILSVTLLPTKQWTYGSTWKLRQLQIGYTISLAVLTCLTLVLNIVRMCIHVSLNTLVCTSTQFLRSSDISRGRIPLKAAKIVVTVSTFSSLFTTIARPLLLMYVSSSYS